MRRTSSAMKGYAFSVPKRSRLGSLVAGLGSLAAVWPTVTPATRVPARSDLEALRGDADRIGADMRRVVERERVRVETAKR